MSINTSRVSLSCPVIIAVCAVVLIGLVALAQDKPAPAPAQPVGDHEREVTAAEVPPAALAALKKLAGSATITGFAEEVEHGHTFYEGSWAGASGNVDAIVTPTGDVVAIEEVVAENVIPGPVREVISKEAGAGAKVTFEKQTMILYEAHFKKDGKSREILLTPDARPHHEDGAKGQDEDGDEDEKD